MNKWELAQDIDTAFRHYFHDELFKWAKGNEEAGQRARVQSLKLQKLLKDFRRESVRMYKEKLSKQRGMDELVEQVPNLKLGYSE